MSAIPNQIFIGCPWRTIRAKYESVIDDLVKKYPLSFVIVGRRDQQDAADLLAVIKERLLSSSYAVFDATSGNANVSLEFGIAETQNIQRALYICTHGAGQSTASKDSPIISDLAGKKKNLYKQTHQLRTLLEELCREHNYAKRFERWFRTEFPRATKGNKKRSRALALKLVHSLDGKLSRRRDDVVQELLADVVGYTTPEVDDMVKGLHNGALINCTRGRYSDVIIR